jgi:hypothetical protein
MSEIRLSSKLVNFESANDLLAMDTNLRVLRQLQVPSLQVAGQTVVDIQTALGAQVVEQWS